MTANQDADLPEPTLPFNQCHGWLLVTMTPNKPRNDLTPISDADSGRTSRSESGGSRASTEG